MYNFNFKCFFFFFLFFFTGTSYRLPVQYGKTYLLRLVNAVMNEEMFFGIAKHNITVVAQDGAYIKPITTSYIMITPGQTMDILLTANQAASYYYIAATPFFDPSISTTPFDSSNTSAILQYTGTYTPPTSIPYPTLPNVTDQDAADNFTTRIRSLASAAHPANVPQNITTRIVITVSVNEILCPNASCGGPSGNRISASLNNISFVTPSTDILQAYYRYFTRTPCF
jgi:laccase